jgi:non-ribosomal peptide synthetase component E (peptide arylation enzyme)
MGRLFLHRAGRGLSGVFIYMFVDEIPKISVGKINKVQLRKQFI